MLCGEGNPRTEVFPSAKMQLNRVPLGLGILTLHVAKSSCSRISNYSHSNQALKEAFHCSQIFPVLHISPIGTQAYVNFITNANRHINLIHYQHIFIQLHIKRPLGLYVLYGWCIAYWYIGSCFSMIMGLVDDAKSDLSAAFLSPYTGVCIVLLLRNM